MPQIESVEADLRGHTVTVAFDDEQVSLDAIVKALNEAGYTVPEKKRLN